ncbi:ATP5J [Cordylochernes scorpioides]|uniref:ATP5J n=1 Tax=Cordylochernes scorpioides TaxID=51811 RepID=A0ABY6LAB1_9ARAC|nr:ATP5J [Cordylochernes scorpioides]
MAQKVFQTLTIHRDSTLLCCQEEPWGLCHYLPKSPRPIQKIFLDKVREYNTQKSKSQAGGLVETIEVYRNKLNAEILRLKTQYTQGAKDMSKLPSYTFKDPIIDNPSMEAR